MKQTLQIRTMIDEEAFLEDMIEKLAIRHSFTNEKKQAIPGVNDAVETSSTETYVSGTMAIETPDEKFNMPFITSFLFTCIKLSRDTYSLEWGISLS